jgi:hypothetical protein
MARSTELDAASLTLVSSVNHAGMRLPDRAPSSFLWITSLCSVWDSAPAEHRLDSTHGLTREGAGLLAGSDRSGAAPDRGMRSRAESAP